MNATLAVLRNKASILPPPALARHTGIHGGTPMPRHTPKQSRAGLIPVTSL
jgi:hypothetical protein